MPRQALALLVAIIALASLLFANLLGLHHRSLTGGESAGYCFIAYPGGSLGTIICTR